MKNWVLLAFIGFCFLSVSEFEEERQSPLKRFGLVGKVNYCIEDSYKENVTLKNKSGIKYIYFFNKNGTLEDRRYLVNGREITQNILAYNKDAKVIAEYQFGPLGLFAKDTMIYNNDGLIIETQGTSKTGKSNFLLKYNSDNNVKEIYLRYNGIMVGIDSFNYDKNNKVIEHKNYSYGKLTLKSTKYETNGKTIVQSEFETYGNLKLIRNLRYDKNNNLIESKIFDPEKKLISRILYQYDEKKNNIKIMKYDENNKSTTTIFNYTYDSVGNWIKKKTVNSDNSIYFDVREIKYY